MRTFTLLLLTFFTSLALSAQIVLVDSPASVAGSYEFGDAQFGPSLLDSIWCGDLMLAEPIGACDPLTNDLTGKIALIDRGGCNFTVKVFNAQEAGAVAVIIADNVPGPVAGMGGTDPLVTIPSARITLADGNLLKEALATDVVSVCMGAIVFANDIGATKDDIMVPTMGSVPVFSIDAANSGVLTPAVRINNVGLNPATGISSTTTIDFTPLDGSMSQVYSEMLTSAALGIDTFVIHTTPAFDYSGSEVGNYTVSYEFSSDSMDQQESNNSTSLDFSITENAYAEGPWDFENNRPLQNTGFTIGGDAPETIEFLAGFDVPVGIGYTIDSINFNVSISEDTAPSLDGFEVNVKLYSWRDGTSVDFPTPDNLTQNDEITLVALETVQYTEADGLDAWKTVPLVDLNTLAPHLIPEDGLRYFVGLENTEQVQMFFGFYDDYTFNLRNDLDPTIPDVEIGYLFSTSQIESTDLVDFEATAVFGDGNGGITNSTLALGMFVNDTTTVIIDNAVAELSDEQAKISIFPNPASDVVNMTVTLDEQTAHLQYTITDMQGRQIFVVEKANIKEDISEFNIEALPNGIYNMTITTDKGIKTKRFNVQQ